MAKDGHVTINDRAGFHTKIDAIKHVADQIRDAGKAMPSVAAKATEEASSFTHDGHPAPVYADSIAELQRWADAMAADAETVATDTENAAETAMGKFTAIVTLDDKTASTVQNA